MVEVELRGIEKLNPAVVRDDIQFNVVKPHVDYWEKVDGQWKITLLADAASISGGSKVSYFIPNSNAAWEKMKFIAYVPRPKAKDEKKIIAGSFGKRSDQVLPSKTHSHCFQNKKR